jgi:LmbE family N-acetylglucosaminyl deacetylase
MSAASGRTLLGVWAHPDDEAYLSAGLILEHIARGDRVVIVTATLGEHGTKDPVHWPPQQLAARRHAELRRSLATLGVTSTGSSVSRTARATPATAPMPSPGTSSTSDPTSSLLSDRGHDRPPRPLRRVPLDN